MREWSGDPDDDEGWQQDADRERDSACFPPSDELCAVLPMEIVCASGPWGAVRVREALVYSSGLALELEEVLLRTVESKEEWWSNEGQLDNGHHESRPRLKRLSGESSVRFAGGSGSNERSRRADIPPVLGIWPVRSCENPVQLFDISRSVRRGSFRAFRQRRR